MVAENIVMMKCPECGYKTTTPADNTLVKCGDYKCPEDEEGMTPIARYEKVVEAKNI